jgi:hypothetical protein
MGLASMVTGLLFRENVMDTGLSWLPAEFAQSQFVLAAPVYTGGAI